MSTFRSKLRRQLIGFKKFWDEYKRVKSGVVGLAIIIIAAAVAYTGPLFIDVDPLRPLITDYPAGTAPIAAELAYPSFYKLLPGGENLSENMKMVPDFRFSSEDSMKGWVSKVSTEFATVMYTPNEGRENDGAIKIVYSKPSGVVPEKETVITLLYNFSYPYGNPPRDFRVHYSYSVKGNVTKNSPVKIELSFLRFQGATPLKGYDYVRYEQVDSNIIYIYPLKSWVENSPTGWQYNWIRSISLSSDPLIGYLPQKTVFPTAGNYSFQITVTIDDKSEEETNIEVYFDDIDTLFYGEVYGILGTDRQKGAPRDILISLILGARLSITLGILATIISTVIGLLVGLIAGYFGGVIDEILMRITDILMCLPGLPLILVLVVVLGRSIFNLLLVLSFLGWMGFARSIRSLTLSLRERAFVEAARAVGGGGLYIIARHIFPNVITLVYLTLALSVPNVIASEASLSFLGLFDPNVISWGRMLYEFSQSGVATTSAFGDYWFWVIPPGLGIGILSVAFIMVGYSLDEILNPKLRVRR